MALEAVYPFGGGSLLTVLAEDRLQDLRMTRRTRSFEDMSDADIIEQIAGEHNLSPDVMLAGPTHRVVTQVNLSDLAFIRERARTLNGEVWVVGRTLYARSRADRRGNTLNLYYGSSLHTFRVCADLAHQCSELRVTGWDVTSKDAIEGIGDSSAISSEINGGTSGSAILEEALGRRIASVAHTVPLTGYEADQIARARYQERARRFVTGSGTTDGDTRIRVGITLTLSGLGRMFDGDYDVTRVLHTYSTDLAFQTAFDVERAWIG
jgi:phage protein D